MLAIFHKAFAHPPQELNSPGGGRRLPRNPEEILREFHSVHPGDSFSATFSGGAALACVTSHSNHSPQQRHNFFYPHILYLQITRRKYMTPGLSFSLCVYIWVQIVL